MKNANYVHAALRPLWSVLHVSGSSQLATTLHASFSDYMFDSSRSKQYHRDPMAHNQIMALRCFDLYRNLHPQFNICGLVSSYMPDDRVEELDERIQKVISTELFYASRYWAMHFQSSTVTAYLLSELEEFLSVRLLLWMEVMNLKKCTAEMPKSLEVVERSEVGWPMELDALVHDARRFTSTFLLGAMSDSTPHIYTSMLPFWPKSSPISKAYAKRVQGMVCPEGTAIGQRCHGLLSTWNLHTATSSALSPDGSQIAVGGWLDILLLDSSTGRRLVPPLKGHVNYSTQSGESVVGPLVSDRILSVAFSPGGHHIAFGTSTGEIHVRDARSGEPVMSLPSEDGNYVKSVKYSPDGCSIAACYINDPPVLVWDVQSGQVLRALGPGSGSDDRSGYFNSSDISPDGTRVAFGSQEGRIYIWDFAITVPGGNNTLCLVSFSNDGSYLLSGTANGFVCMWDIRSGDLVVGPLEGGHTSSIILLRFFSEGTRFISGSIDGAVSLWDTRSTITIPSVLRRYSSDTTSVRFSSKGEQIVSHSYDRTLCLWDTGSGEMSLGPLQTDDRFTRPEFSPDYAHIALLSSGSLKLLDSRTGNIAFESSKQHGSVQSVAFSSHEICIMSSRLEGIVRLSAANTGQTLMVFHLPRGEDEDSTPILTSAKLSPDCTLIAIGLDWAVLNIYATHDGRMVSGPFNAQFEASDSIKISSNNILIGYATEHGSLVIREVQDGREMFEFQIGEIISFEFSLDGSQIVSSSTDRGVCVERSNGTTPIWPSRRTYGSCIVSSVLTGW
ncbi:hypothetical protein RhiTH_004611 [Rhizoctonia solani]